MLDTGDDPPFGRPVLGRIAELAKTPLLAGFGKTSLGVGKPRRGQCRQPRVLGQTQGSDAPAATPGATV